MRRTAVPGALIVLLCSAAFVAARWTAAAPPIDVAHIIAGEINRWGEAVGYHYREHGVDPPGARVLRIVEPPDSHGVYRALVALRDPATGAWIEKRAPSTFFPDAMRESAVLAAVRDAFGHGRLDRDGRFIGPSGHGFTVEGWYEHGRIVAAYPLRNPR